MATLQELEKLARKIVGREIEVQYGRSRTDGTTIWVEDFAHTWPRLPERALDDMARFVTGHEAGHIHVNDGEARKRGLPGMSSEEFYQIFADPLSPGAESTDYVRFIQNIVEDRLFSKNTPGVVGGGRPPPVNPTPLL